MMTVKNSWLRASKRLNKKSKSPKVEEVSTSLSKLETLSPNPKLRLVHRKTLSSQWILERERS